MISHLRISRFKRFVDEAFDFAPLTVLTGTNGAGKTSVIHALLLAREACSDRGETVQLNGPFGLELGTAQDVLNVNAALDSSEIEVCVHFEQREALFRFDARGEGQLYLPIMERPPHRADVPALGGSARDFCYLSAERLGPRDVLGASATAEEELEVGVRGEYSAQLLAVHGLHNKNPKKPKVWDGVAEARRHPDADGEFLKYQTEAWLSDIVRPIELDTIWFPNTAMTALRFRPPSGDWVRAPNMGFGVSYALPIVLAGLYANDGALIIIENPEAHLHPAGQSRVGHFLAKVAASGVQVLVETHSDHVLNGIRRAVADSVISHERAVVHFFDAGLDTGGLERSTLRFTSEGGLSDWPKRFFDQYEIDVVALSRRRRQKAGV